MTWLRIEIDAEQLVRQSYRGLPRWQRLVIWLLGEKDRVIAEAARKFSGEEARP